MTEYKSIIIAYSALLHKFWLFTILNIIYYRLAQIIMGGLALKLFKFKNVVLHIQVLCQCCININTYNFNFNVII